MAEELSSFDPDTFVNVEYEESIDTTITPVPEDEWPATSVSVKFRKQMTKDGERALMDVLWEILDDSVREVTKLDRPMCRQTIFLDINDAGGLDMSKGKNRQLGLLRTALGQNSDARWSAGMLVGKLATVKVVHSPNPDDKDNPYANVKKVTVA